MKTKQKWITFSSREHFVTHVEYSMSTIAFDKCWGCKDFKSFLLAT